MRSDLEYANDVVLLSNHSDESKVCLDQNVAIVKASLATLKCKRVLEDWNDWKLNSSPTAWLTARSDALETSASL